MCSDGYFFDGKTCITCSNAGVVDKDASHTGGECMCVEGAEWSFDSFACLCANQSYFDGSKCTACSESTSDRVDLSGFHHDGECACVANASWSNSLN